MLATAKRHELADIVEALEAERGLLEGAGLRLRQGPRRVVAELSTISPTGSGASGPPRFVGTRASSVRPSTSRTVR
jgi:hypothetical protein